METHSYNQEPDLEDMTEMGVNTEEELTVDPVGSDNHLPGFTKPLNYGHQEGCICPQWNWNSHRMIMLSFL